MTSLPIKVSGRVGELVAELYEAGTKGKNFDKLVKELEAFVAAVQSGGLVVDRFFSTANYSPEECKKVLETLLTTKESLASFKDIKDAEVKEVLVDNEGNLDAWRNVRKAVQAIGLSDTTKALLEKLAAEAHLNRAKKVAAVAAELRAVAAKTVDAVVTSAVALSKAQQEAVSKALPAYAPSGQSVTISYAVDPAVLGGLLITIGNTTVDLTAVSKLAEASSAAHKQLA